MSLHQPVLLNETLSFLKSMNGPPRFFLDSTFGRGGHSLAILKEFPEVKIVGLDRDAAAIEYGKKHFVEFIKNGRLQLIQSNFSDYSTNGDFFFDAILMDLGVSSPQLDDATRGFSFYNEGPLDMRMDKNQELSAAYIVNELSEKEIADIFYNYGEVKKSFQVARSICEYRKTKPFETTVELAQVIAKVLGWRKKGHHPATECFLALRMVVNDELGHIKKAILNFVKELSPGGRLLIITFHSIEDREVKKLLFSLTQWGRPAPKKVIKPTREEQTQNPRSRSAQLRVFERQLA